MSLQQKTSSGPLFDLLPHNGTATSRAAAKSIEGGAKSLRASIYTYILGAGERGATDDEIQAALAMNPSTQRPRRGELAQRGLIQRNGLTRPSVAGRQCDVWVAVHQGGAA